MFGGQGKHHGVDYELGRTNVNDESKVSDGQ